MNKMVLFFALLVCFSCAEKLIEQPENLISKEKMVALLRDLAVLNSARATNVSILRRNNVEIMPYLYTKYGIDSTQFSNSDLYYASVPEEYEDIYTKVEAQLESEKLALEATKKINDSLKVEERKKKKETINAKASQP